MYELFFELVAYTHDHEYNSNMFLLTHEIIGGRRPFIPDSIEYNYTDKEKYYLSIMQVCWQGDEQIRPTFIGVCEELEKIQNFM